MDQTLNAKIKLDLDDSNVRSGIKEIERLVGGIKLNLGNLQEIVGLGDTDFGKDFGGKKKELASGAVNRIISNIDGLRSIGTDDALNLAQLYEEQYIGTINSGQKTGSISVLDSEEYKNIVSFEELYSAIPQSEREKYSQVKSALIKQAQKKAGEITGIAVDQWTTQMHDARQLGDGTFRDSAIAGANENLQENLTSVTQLRDVVKNLNEVPDKPPAGKISILDSEEYQNILSFGEFYSGIPEDDKNNYSQARSSLVKDAQKKAREITGIAVDQWTTQMHDARQMDAGAERESAIANANANFKESIDSVQGLTDAIKTFTDGVDSATESTQKSGRMLPAYIGTVINSLGQALNMYARYDAMDKTMFNLDSAQGMSMALSQKDIEQTRMLYSGGSRLLGTAIGGAIGGFAGAALAPFTGGASVPLFSMSGSMAGSYLGQQVLGPIGDALGISATAEDEMQMKVLGSSFGKNQQLSQFYMGVQNSNYNLRRFGGEDGNPAKHRYRVSGFEGYASMTEIAGAQGQFEKMNRGRNDDYFTDLYGFAHYAGFGGEATSILKASNLSKYTGRYLTSNNLLDLGKKTGMSGDYGSMIDQLSSISMGVGQKFGGGEKISRNAGFLSQLPSAILGNKDEYGRLSQAGMQTVNSMISLANPKDEAQRAFMYRALSSDHPDDNFLQIQERMLRGGFDKDNIISMLKTLPKDKDRRLSYLQAIIPEASSDLRTAIAENKTFDGKTILEKVEGLGPVDSAAVEETMNGWLGKTPQSLSQKRTQRLESDMLIGGAKVAKQMTDIEVDWNEGLINLTTSATMLAKISKATRESITKMNAILTEVIVKENEAAEDIERGKRNANAWSQRKQELEMYQEKIQEDPFLNTMDLINSGKNTAW